MKTFALVLFTAFSVAVSPVSAGIDFTLKYKAMETDAVEVDKPYFMDGPSKIYLQIPGNWQVSSAPAGIDCISNIASSQVRFEKYQGPALTIDETGGRTLVQQVIGHVPEGAKNIVALPMQLNPLPLYGWADVEVALRYEFFGQIMRRNVMYLHMLPGRDVVFSVVAPEADFNKVYKQARAILTSWFEPSRDLPPDLASKFESGGGMKKN